MQKQIVGSEPGQRDVYGRTRRRAASAALPVGYCFGHFVHGLRESLIIAAAAAFAAAVANLMSKPSPRH